jgi:hypothetical protein
MRSRSIAVNRSFRAVGFALLTGIFCFANRCTKRQCHSQRNCQGRIRCRRRRSKSHTPRHGYEARYLRNNQC